MKKLLCVLLMALATAAIVAAGGSVRPFSLTQSQKEADAMAYCTIADLEDTYGEERIGAWGRVDPDRVDKAITDAGAEIDGYLLSGGYTVPLPGAPATIRKYCIDIACATLVISAGMLESDPDGKAVVEQAKIARAYLTKVAEGKFKIPGYSTGDGEVSKAPAGNVRFRSGKKMDLRGYV
jgi:phage gp36-like protein